jgi:geranylgeranyl diphosphate synthase, type II
MLRSSPSTADPKLSPSDDPDTGTTNPEPTALAAQPDSTAAAKHSEQTTPAAGGAGRNDGQSTYAASASGLNGDSGHSAQSEQFLVQWKERAGQVETHLREHMLRWTAGGPHPLVDAIEYSLMAPGKRLRPLLALWAAEVVGGDYSVAFPAAVAVELIHCYSLIHDDLPAMDDDDLRRGRPTCHIQFDESTAILAGDALQPMAFAVLAHSFQPPELAARACQLLAVAAGPVALVGGQADDLQAEKTDWSQISEPSALAAGGARETDAKSLLARIHARKTGAMIRVSLELGALAARATPEQMAAIGLYGQAIGQSFQIVDDLLDVQSTSEQLGKRAGKDEAAGKLTYPRLYGVPESILAAKDYTEKAIRALEMFGSRGEPLIRLAETILERTH